MPETSAPPHADLARDPLDAIEVVHQILGDTLAVLKARDAFPLSAADLPNIRTALEAAIYDSGPVHCDDCDGATGEPCARHAALAGQCSRWTELLHRLNGKAS